MSNKKSQVWNFFESSNTKFVNCTLCNLPVSRGGEGKNASTSPLLLHLRRHHKKEYDSTFEGGSSSGSSASASTSRQTSLMEYKQWKIDDKKAIDIHTLIGEMICLDNQPFSIVEDKGFRRLLFKLAPNYNIPSRTYFRKNVIPNIYERLRSKIENRISKSEIFSMTTDMWTCPNTNKAFLSLTAHFITEENWTKQHILLACRNFTGSHTGMEIGNKISSILNEWNIAKEKVHLILRDSGANMIKALTEINLNSESCFSHKLQLVVNDALKSQRAISDMVACGRRIATHFNHSTQACEKLEKIQLDLQEKPLKVIQDVATRWNSTYYMLERLLIIKRSLTLYCLENNCSPLSNNQWDLLESTVKLLQPFEEVTKAISAENSTIGDIIPAYKCLKRCLEQNGDLYGVGTFKEALYKGLEERCSNLVSNKNYSIASFIDPRYKDAFFSTHEKESLKLLLINELSNMNNNNAESETTDSDDEPLLKKINYNNSRSSPGNASSLWKCFDDIAESSNKKKKPQNTRSTADEIEAYLEKSVLDRGSCPFEYWKNENKNFPQISKLVLKYLSSPGTSVPSERLFSEMKHIFSPSRSSLDVTLAEKIVFIHENFL